VRLEAEIAAHPADQRNRFRILQIKEKLGRLRLAPRTDQLGFFASAGGRQVGRDLYDLF